MDNISKLTTEDGAAEKLVGEGKSESRDQKVEIKYMNDSQNGDTKIDIGNLKSAFVGMGKEELMKFANDPFWVKMRWFLFILFWVLWFAMLGGAIAIIVLAPKCAAPTPREWYEQSPIYKVDISDLINASTKEGELEVSDLEKRLDYFKDLGVTTLLVDSVMKRHDENPDLIDDFMSPDPQIGSVEDFKKLGTALKNKGMHILMSFVPNYSSDKNDWFLKSEEKDGHYTDYYIWADKNTDVDSQRGPPNNWLSVTGGSAWEWSEKRGQFYLHQFNKSQPDFNFRNEEVVEQFQKIFLHWLDLGFSGFYLKHIEYLIEDEHLRNETVDSDAVGTTHNEYSFYTHRHTKHLPETIKLVKQWSNAIKNQSGVIVLTGLTEEEGSGLAQLLNHPLKVSSILTAGDLFDMISKRLNGSSPVWEFECEDSQYCVDEELAKSLQMTLLLLPGTSVIKVGDRIPRASVWTTEGDANLTTTTEEVPKTVEAQKLDQTSFHSIYKILIEARQTPSVMYGATQPVVLNSTVFAFSRIKSGNPGYLVAINLGDSTASVDFTSLRGVPPEVTVVTATSQFEDTVTIKGKISSTGVSIPGKACVVVTFVPDTESSGSA